MRSLRRGYLDQVLECERLPGAMAMRSSPRRHLLPLRVRRLRVSRARQVTVLGYVLLHAGAAGAVPWRYAVDAELIPATRTIAGRVEVDFDNTATVSLDEVALVLYPNRFAVADPGIDDVNRPFVHPREEHVAGGATIESLEAESGGVARAVEEVRLDGLNGWRDTLLRARLPAPLAPGRRATLRLRFRTVLPERYGSFGVAEGRVTALGGWFPELAALAADGTWQPQLPASPAQVRGQLGVPADYTVALGRALAPAGHPGALAVAADGGGAPSLLASEDYRIARRDVEGATVVLLELPVRRALAFPRRRPRAELVLDAIERILRQRPVGVPLPTEPLLRERPGGVPLPVEPLLVAEAPLRLELTAPPRPGVAVVSDRLLRVFHLLREFHERELAAAVYGALLAGTVAARETPADAPWVLEGLAADRADRYLAAAHPRHRTVYDWIGLFDVFAIVDRFESAPKIPFGRAFFPEARRADELGDGVETFARTRAHGRTIFTKLRNVVGEAAYAETIARYLSGSERFRDAAAAVHGATLDWLFAQWTEPYPALDYALTRASLNQPAGAGGSGAGDPARVDALTSAAGGAAGSGQAGSPPAAAASSGGADEPAYAHRLTVERRAARALREPVEVEVRGRDGERARLVWEGAGDRGDLTLRTSWPAARALLDPDRRLLEDTRADNARPPLAQVVLDSADVTITSSEFGMSGLFVARRRYDYTRDIGLIAFFSDRSAGMHLGPRLHWGVPNDAATYRHNLYGYYTLAELRGDFGDDSRPAKHDDGTLAGLGFRYDYTDEIAYDNPTDTTKARLFADWYTGALGSTFDYVQGGIRLSVVRPLRTPRTLVAAQLLNAFSVPVGHDRVPNQGRFSLGGDLAIRGIPVHERLGENVALVRAELRHTVYPEVDLNFMDLLVLRHGQLRFFVDAARVEDRRSSLYRLSDFAVGVGVGAAAMYDFMGFYPAVAYVAIAQRVDRFAGVDNDVQFLFGTRQTF